MNTKENYEGKINNNWRLLGLRVIDKAMDDYTKAIAKKKFEELSGIKLSYKEENVVNGMIAECEQFFLGERIMLMSDVPGKDYLNIAYQKGIEKGERKYKSYCKKHRKERSA